MSNIKDRKVKFITVTADVAEKWLKKNKCNRDIRPSVVEAYALAMKRGEWVLTAEPIMFSQPYTDPVTSEQMGEVLMNGQHRLMAVMKAGVPVDFTVWWHCDPQEFKVIDQNCPRTGGDILSYTRKDLKYPISVASCVGSFVRFSLGEPTKIHSWVVDAVLEHFEAEVIAIAEAKQRLAKLAPRPVVAALMLGQIVNPSQNGVLMKQVKEAIGFTERDPARALHLYVTNQLIGGQRDTPDQMFYKACNAVAAKMEGRSLQVLRVNSDGLVWLRTSCIDRLSPCCRAIMGRMNSNFLTPKLVKLGEDRVEQNTVVQPVLV